MPKNIPLESFLDQHILFFTLFLFIIAFFLQLVILKQTRGKNRWLWFISRFIPIIAIEIFTLRQLLFDRKMALLHGTVYSKSILPWFGFMVFVGYAIAWYVYAVILEREEKKAGKVFHDHNGKLV